MFGLLGQDEELESSKEDQSARKKQNSTHTSRQGSARLGYRRQSEVFDLPSTQGHDGELSLFVFQSEREQYRFLCIVVNVVTLESSERRRSDPDSPHSSHCLRAVLRIIPLLYASRTRDDCHV
jgi:hypothetical protein